MEMPENTIGLKNLVPGLVILALIGITAVLIALAGQCNVSTEVPVALRLPDRLDGWHGEDVFCCQNEKCMRTFGAAELAGGRTCKSCGGPLLESWSLAEKRLLPSDTLLVKKRYSNDAGKIMTVSIVVSGSESTSIHRPQICLVGQGFRLLRQDSLDVPLPGRDPLQVKILDLAHGRSGSEGGGIDSYSSFAYWFAGGGYETAGNFHRSFLMLFERIVLGRVSRWAYIAVGTSRTPGSDAYRADTAEFIRVLYPVLRGGKP